MTETPYTPKVGDKVVIKADVAPMNLRGVVFEVRKVNPRNVQANRIGGGRGINYPKEYLEKFDGELDPTKNVSLGVPYVPVEFFDIGQIVSAKNISAKNSDSLTTETPLVVFKDDGKDKVNVTLLGGNGGRYWRWPRAGLVKRDLAWLKDRL